MKLTFLFVSYFRSGDLLKLNEDGFYYFGDRVGDTFRWKSENVATTEVAQALGLYPAIAEANVYGVLVPHHDGRAGMAAIVVKEEWHILVIFDEDSDRGHQNRPWHLP